jgi:xylan 1,4-beta-xylosidase
VKAALDFSPTVEGDEAGLTVLMNESHHYDLAVTRYGDKRQLIVCKRIGDLMSIVAQTRFLTESSNYKSSLTPPATRFNM